MKELDKNYREFMDLRDKGIVVKNERMTFQELSDMWLTNTKIGNVKSQTITNLKSQLKALNNSIGFIRVQELKVSDLEKYRASQISTGKIDQYNKAVSHIKSILSYGVEKDILVKNVALEMKAVKYNGLREKRAMSDHERQLLQKANFNDFEQCFTQLLLYTGMRKSEALALNVSDINFSSKYVAVNKTLVSSRKKEDILQWNTKTDAGTRKIPLPEQLIPLLKQYCRGRIGILFESQYGGYLNSTSFYKRWKTIKKKLTESNDNIPIASDFTPHLFRHTYASDLYKAGIGLKSAQYLLGHSDIKTTMDTYTHFGYTDVKINCLEQYYETVKRQSDKIQKTPEAL